MYPLEYTGISKVFFMPYHVGRHYTNVVNRMAEAQVCPCLLNKAQEGRTAACQEATHHIMGRSSGGKAPDVK
jgi:hypothetical protein